MESVISYIVQVNLYLSLFFLCYLFFLRHDTLFRRNRLYLLASLVFSVSFPLIQLPDFAKAPVSQAVDDSALLEGVTIFENLTTVETSTSWSWQEVVLIVYVIGFCLFAFRFLKGFGGILYLAIKHGVRKEQGAWVVRLDDSWQPFSFFFLLFWADQPEMEEEEKRQVWEHELAHIRQWHSMDVLLFEWLSIVCWFNPVCFMYQQAIRQVHEFLADEAVAGHHRDKSAYATLLLGQFFAVRQLHLSNHFMNKHFLKRRIMMLNQSKTSQKAMYKLLVALPIIVACFFIQACSEKILEPGNSAVVFTPIKTYDLAAAPQGQDKIQYTLVLSKGMQYRINSLKEDAVDFKNIGWTLQRLEEDTDNVAAEVVSWKQGEQGLEEVTFEVPETGKYYMTFYATNNAIFKGKMQMSFYRSEAMKKQKNEDYEKFLNSLPVLKEVSLTEETIFNLNLKEGNFFMVITGDQDSPNVAEGWSIELYNAAGEKKAANVFGGRYFTNFAYKAKEAGEMKVMITKTANAAPNSKATFRFQEQ